MTFTIDVKSLKEQIGLLKRNDLFSFDNTKEMVSEFEIFLKTKMLEIESDVYEEFSDYIEMVIQFGYITMFAAALPLGAFFSLVFNIIEMYSDKYKL